LDIVAEKVGDGNVTTGSRIMLDLITEHPELRGVFASNLVMAQGAAQTLAENSTNKTGDKINLVGFGSNDELVKFLQNGTIAALLVQDPFRTGYDGVKIALAASRGGQVPANLDTGGNVITKANMSSDRSQELLHPRIK
jgi:ribose transport system substrate-binding protein